MIHFSYTGQGETLCGEPQLEADLKDGKLCDDCIQVMWKEQYRRNTLNRVVKREKKKPKLKPRDSPLPPHRGISKKKLFLKDWRKYGVKT